MENSDLKGRILEELKSLISRSCKKGPKSGEFRNLHQLLVRKHYNAADVAIDYHRKRIIMDVVADDQAYDPRTINLDIPTFRLNLLYKNLRGFLESCIATDQKSIAFYAWLLRCVTKKEVPLTLV